MAIRHPSLRRERQLWAIPPLGNALERREAGSYIGGRPASWNDLRAVRSMNYSRLRLAAVTAAAAISIAAANAPAWARSFAPADDKECADTANPESAIAAC